MFVEILLTVNEMEEDLLRGKTAVVIDTLRATSTIATALYNGAAAVLPQAGIEESLLVAQKYIAGGKDPHLLGGERGGMKVEKFHLGNSPLEYTQSVVKGKTVILSTTNGTRAIKRGQAAGHLLIGSMLNSHKTMERAVELGQDLVLCCSGTQGHFSLEDFVTAGAMISDLHHMGVVVGGDDRIQTAHLLYDRYAEELPELMSCSQNGTRLVEIGQQADIEFCARKDTYPIVCTCQNNRVYSLPIIR